MVGISSMLRLVILAIVAIGMSHAAAVEADATAAAELKADTSVPHGGDAVVYDSEAGSAPSIKGEGESPSVTEGGDSVGYGCGTSSWPHSCWEYCPGGGWCWTKPTVNCFQDQDCAGDPPCTSSC